ncbi:hypothetical protein B9Z45_16715, partial [Limnohabitans sp. 2KL-17]
TSKYSEEQLIGFLRQAVAGMPIKEIGRKPGFSDASFVRLALICRKQLAPLCRKVTLADPDLARTPDINQ